jgi:hypothetical protein
MDDGMLVQFAVPFNFPAMPFERAQVANQIRVVSRGFLVAGRKKYALVSRAQT